MLLLLCLLTFFMLAPNFSFQIQKENPNGKECLRGSVKFGSVCSLRLIWCWRSEEASASSLFHSQGCCSKMLAQGCCSIPSNFWLTKNYMISTLFSHYPYTHTHIHNYYTNTYILFQHKQVNYNSSVIYLNNITPILLEFYLH